MLGLGIGIAGLAVTQQDNADFQDLPAGVALLFDDALPPSTPLPPVLEEGGALLTEEI
ncbi:hypothetical protein N7E02_23380 [Aliirhizobium terrae]|uniref:hypothetical protein n=1 Tax=Terrirhizobium terrae TaxID=2926709 RepID=UPI0025781F1C|nr:hypothetical protein [Rhizobium sp. CC-CFT758]WJH39675.1 hypothetical protein N7E02_23380 [Rhizobium sp. CC-CFT758]